MDPPCPANAFRYNTTLCSCNPGHFLSAGRCVLFALPSVGDFEVKSSLVEEPSVWWSVFRVEGLRRSTRSQAVFLLATAAALVAWLVFCGAIRFGRLRGGRSVWFRVRWWVSRLDFFFSTRHWTDDRTVVMKRKTELGGTFSTASWILFLGLLSALLYQVITKRKIEMHRVKPSNAPDFLSFVNDMEFNITTVSSMSCSNLRDLGTVMTGTPGVDFRMSPLTNYANYSCYNTTRGPTITIRCSQCQIPLGNFFISWNFIDLPNHPASAVAFHFNLTAKDHNQGRLTNYVSATVKSGRFMDDSPRTFRGPDVNILKVHLFPKVYRKRQNISIIQPLFHDFLPGSAFSGASQLQASLQNSSNGLVNTTLNVRFLSDYILEIDQQNILGLVTFFANVGGLLAFSVAIFLFFLLQFESRSKRFHNEDIVFWNTISRNRARKHWNKVRKYVMYTWGINNLEEERVSTSRCCSMLNSFPEAKSVQEKTHQVEQASRNHAGTKNAPVEMKPIEKSVDVVKAAQSSANSA